jgi:hypothetical protein
MTSPGGCQWEIIRDRDTPALTCRIERCQGSQFISYTDMKISIQGPGETLSPARRENPYSEAWAWRHIPESGAQCHRMMVTVKVTVTVTVTVTATVTDGRLQ